jgi:hypothetical protein
MQILMRRWALCAVTGMLAQFFQPLSLAHGQGRIGEGDRNQPQVSDQSRQEPSSRESSSQETPSRELLEFLLEYGDIDEASFELIVFHGKRDSELADEQKHNIPHAKELLDDH